MRLSDCAKNYYLDQNKNCAVALLLGGSDYYKLELNEQDATLLTGFGGGIGCGAVCGCLAGSVAVLGKMFSHRADFRKICAGFAQLFSEQMGGSENCRDIMPRFIIKPGFRCYGAVAKAADLLQDYIAKIKD